MKNSPFKACGEFIDLFYKYGEANGSKFIMRSIRYACSSRSSY